MPPKKRNVSPSSCLTLNPHVFLFLARTLVAVYCSLRLARELSCVLGVNFPVLRTVLSILFVLAPPPPYRLIVVRAGMVGRG